MPGAPLETLIAGLMQFGFAYMPDFALLVCGGDGRRHLLCRGSGSAAVTGGDGGLQRVSGAGLATWLDYPMPAGATCVAIGEQATESSLLLPAAAGIFLASTVIVNLTAPALQSRPVPVIAPAEPASLAAVPPPGWPPPAALAPAAEPAPEPAPGPAPGPSWPAGGEADGPGYDFLFEATQGRSVEDAAIRPDSSGDSLFSFPGGASSFPGSSPDKGPSPEWHAPAAEGPVAERPAPEGTVPERTVPEIPAPLRGTGPTGMIESVPWASARPPVPPPPAHLDPSSTLPPRALMSTITIPPPLPPGASEPPPGPVIPENTETIRRGSLSPPVRAPALTDRIGPTVQALVCLAGHVSPPNSVTCRVCSEPLPPQEPVLAPRPALGILRLSTGDVITLDRSVVMGRNPRSELEGDERPHVVKLPGGDGEISRTHLVVTLDGWHVLLTDLQSTNGTMVGLPGHRPERLRPRSPFPSRTEPW